MVPILPINSGNCDLNDANKARDASILLERFLNKLMNKVEFLSSESFRSFLIDSNFQMVQG